METEHKGSQQINEKRALLGEKILCNCRNELYSYFPYMDGAFVSVEYEASAELTTIGTEGEKFYFHPQFLMERYRRKPQEVRRGYLHMLLHCLYLHLFREEGYDGRIWNLACDISVEMMIQRTGIAGILREESLLWQKCSAVLTGKEVSAQQIYQMLLAGRFPYPTEELEREFHFDDHSLWEQERNPVRRAQTKKKWEKVLAYTGQNKNDRKRKAGTKRGSEEEDLELVCPSKYDYRRFLKQFAVLREEVEMDVESFDYIFYNYGIQEYGNMPLIEPLEYKEVHRLEELVIAIDTSGSCSAQIVQQFLEETYAILSEKENFFHKMKVYLLQCDCCIQEAVVLHSEEEWKEYSNTIKIHGRGGTDFRPVFRYVEELKQRKELKHLRALIYFTDGDGIYPAARPDYETAFVFLRKTAKMELVPGWAMKLVVNG